MHLDGQIDKQMNRLIDRKADGLIDLQVDGRTDRQTDKLTDGQLGRQMTNRCGMDDGKRGRQIDRQIDGWKKISSQARGKYRERHNGKQTQTEILVPHPSTHLLFKCKSRGHLFAIWYDKISLGSISKSISDQCL